MYVLSFTIDTSLISDYNIIHSHLSLISDLSTGRLTEIKKETSPMTTKLHPGMKEFNSIFKKCNHIYHEIALKLNLSDSGFDVLYALCSLGDGCLQRDICEFTLLSKQTIHSSVKKLVNEGYLSLDRVSPALQEICRRSAQTCRRDIYGLKSIFYRFKKRRSLR